MFVWFCMYNVILEDSRLTAIYRQMLSNNKAFDRFFNTLKLQLNKEKADVSDMLTCRSSVSGLLRSRDKSHSFGTLQKCEKELNILTEMFFSFICSI